MERQSVASGSHTIPPAARRRGTAREIALALTVKACLLAALYFLFFGPTHRPPAGPAATAAALIGPAGHKDQR